MSPSPPADFPRRPPALSLRHQGDGAALVDAGERRVAALDVHAAALWELCDGETSVEEIAVAICSVWDVEPDLARQDVERTLRELAENGFLLWTPSDG